ncbi:hypothetical protein QBC33DRAFT_559284 [Phialemonium atrogriseum]|uniref:Uncharacterized protein n=1 Tax=Phialemonium atrogriseum TaxID=1093897 RepID=A0AAJ0FNH3_9PEZI|nr:uncharacterized protein QBC33DRAFT_559284 [Phialemonium atrogriseum]KAK1767160.1 hypothetical protein QBC33DRAFT_559284 [Phialemonium atrogriseum]
MSHNLTNNALTAVKGFLDPQISNGRLNPVHLAIATRGYWIQSHVLHIPDRFGFFSSGPPRLQMYQSASFAFLTVGVAFSTVWGALTVLLAKLMGRPISRLAGAMGVLQIAVVAVIWAALACFDHRRALDYDWGDWKRRKE